MRYYLLLVCLCLTVWLHGQSACSREQAEVIIEVQTDRYGYETSWELTGQTATRYGFRDAPTYKSQRLYRDTICIPSTTCITFTIHDGFGDGIASPGYYLVLLNGDTIASGGAFYSQEASYLQCAEKEICPLAMPVTPGTYTAQLDDSWYQFTPDSSGIYRISTRNGNTCDTKIWVYATCTGITIAEDNQSTVFFNDNYTAQIVQAEVKGYFKKNKTYWIRIGDRENACVDSIRWALTFEGPLRGCMNPASCNYNPLATIDDGSCLLEGNFRCPPGPDLLIRQDTLLSSMRVDTIHSENSCLVQEGCLRGYGVREVLRFSTQIENIGERDYFIGTPDYNNPQFTWNNCHNHFHYDNYAEYLMIDEQGNRLPAGFKNGLCITDFGCEPGYNPKFSCDNMGISAHCYDTYWSGLKCQWIDVTDLPDGNYTFVARINWKNSADALGQVEKNMKNNVAQVCLRLSRSSGQLKCTLLPACEPYLDCAGVPYGNAVPDCMGICNGNNLTGDVNGNGTQEVADAENYVTLMLGKDIEPSPCNDLNADGAITVQDAVLLASCLNFGAAHAHAGAGTHNHCQFPMGNLLNGADTVTLGILSADWDQKYVDIGILNQTVNVTAYQFRLSGGIIGYVENLVDENTYPITPRTNMSDGMVIGLSYRDSVIYKSEWMQPLCRVHFLNLAGDTIQLKEIIDIINSNHERVIHQIGKEYVVRPRVTKVPKVSAPTSIQISPNPFHNEAQFTFYNPTLKSFRLDITNINGEIVRQYKEVESPGIRLAREDLPAGIYFYKLIGEDSYATGKFVIRG